MPFHFRRLSIPDVVLVEPSIHADERGSFAETYKYSEFAAFGIRETFVQDNCARSVRGVLRGLHFQKGASAQAKLVRVLSGTIFDVVVDLRRSSPTYGTWVGMHLSAEGAASIFVPAGFAHGYCVLSDSADVSYKTSREYDPEQERGVVWNDPTLGIAWPIGHPLLSQRDSGLPVLQFADAGFD